MILNFCWFACKCFPWRKNAGVDSHFWVLFLSFEFVVLPLTPYIWTLNKQLCSPRCALILPLSLSLTVSLWHTAWEAWIIHIAFPTSLLPNLLREEMLVYTEACVCSCPHLGEINTHMCSLQKGTASCCFTDTPIFGAIVFDQFFSASTICSFPHCYR